MPALDLRLPDMVVRVDESRRDDLGSAVNHLGRNRWRVNVRRNASNLIAINKQGMVPQRHDVIVACALGHEQSRILQQDGLGRSHNVGCAGVEIETR